MAITLRGTKGGALTHDELDNNFREFFYSASVEGSSVLFHRYTAISSSLSFPVDPPSGRDGYIQLKSGNAISGANAVHTGSANFLFDYNNKVLKVTGSSITIGDTSTTGTVSITGSSNITGNLVVGGTVTAEEFITERVATSYVYKSGSTKFGDSSDDNHAFTGSLELTGRLEVVGPTTQSGDVVLTGNTVTVGNYNITGDNTQVGKLTLTGNQEITGSIEVTGGSNKIRFYYDSTGSLPSATTYHGMFAHTHAEGKAWFAHANNWVELATSESVQQTYLKNTTDVLDGDLTVTGRLTAQEYHTQLVSSSIMYESGSTKFGDTVDDRHEFTGSVFVTGSVTAHQFTAINGVGTPTLTSPNNIIISASNHVQIKDALLRVNSFTNAETGSLTTTNGDFYYNIDRNLFFGLVAGQHSPFATSGTGLNNIVEDSTPQLGGTLELNGNNISGSGTIDISGSIATLGTITAGGDITAFFSSDERLKDNITPIEGALEKVNQIGGYGFDWNSNSEHSGHDVGVIAQEIEKVLPEVVTTRDNGYKAVRYEKIVALLIQAVKEQQLQIDELKSKL